MTILAEWTADQKWYEAQIVQVNHKTGKFLVSYMEYPDDEPIEVTIGQIKLIGSENRASSRYRSRSRSSSDSHTRARNRSRSRKREREKDTGRGRRRGSSRSRSRSRTRTRTRSSENRHRGRSRSNSSRSKSNDRHKGKDELLNATNLDEMILKQDREGAAAKGRNYARRPTSYYHSLTLPHETGTNRKRSPTPPPERVVRKRPHKEKKRSQATQTTN